MMSHRIFQHYCLRFHQQWHNMNFISTLPETFARPHKSKRSSGNKVPLSTGSAVWIKPRLGFYTPTKNNTRTTNSILHSRFFFPQDGQFRDPWFSLLLKRGLRGGQRPGGVCSSGHRCHAEVGRHRLAEEHYLAACGGQRGFDRWAIHRVCTEGLLSLSNCLSCLYP